MRIFRRRKPLRISRLLLDDRAYLPSGIRIERSHFHHGVPRSYVFDDEQGIIQMVELDPDQPKYRKTMFKVLPGPHQGEPFTGTDWETFAADWAALHREVIQQLLALRASNGQEAGPPQVPQVAREEQAKGLTSS